MQKIEAAAMDHPLGTLTEKNHGTNANRTQGEGDVAAHELHTLMKKRLDEVPGKPFEARPVTIFRLPAWFHESNKDLYEPKMVAIGPYHRGKESLLTMEEHKWYTLRNFLARSEVVGLEVYCQAMRSIETKARQCYNGGFNLRSDEFVMMLLLDACFILELFLTRVSLQMDPVYQVGWAKNALFSDMLLSENQVPFFVIHKLWATQHQGLCTQDCSDRCPLVELILKVFEPTPYYRQFTRPQISCKDIHHLLHLFYSGVVPDATSRTQMKTTPYNNLCGLSGFPYFKLFPKSSKAHTQSSHDYTNIPCVTMLHDAGIKFKRNMEPRNMFDISFENGTIHMPLLQIESIKMRILWNMVVFEQNCKPSNFPQTLSSYLALFDSLINNGKDVAILEQCGILENFSSDAEEAAVFFNQFSNNFVLSRDHYFHDLYKNVKEYSDSTWHTYRARLMHDYFNNPWSIISVVAATILLILTIIQTYYSAAK